MECWISAFDRVQNKAAKFANHSGDSDWQNLAQRRKVERVCALTERIPVRGHGKR